MSCGFVTEKELEEQRQLRQKEWERVRNSDDPQGIRILNVFFWQSICKLWIIL